MRSTHEAAGGGEARWIRHLFGYRDTWLLALLFLAAQALDSLTTMYALGTGRFNEANPMMGSLMSTDPMLGYAFKLAIAILVLSALLIMRLRWRMRRAVLVVLIATSLLAPAANILRLTGHL
ncbi:MAG: DUF5658 family protein [Candidatus Dormibacteria bacterium]